MLESSSGAVHTHIFFTLWATAPIVHVLGRLGKPRQQKKAKIKVMLNKFSSPIRAHKQLKF